MNKQTVQVTSYILNEHNLSKFKDGSKDLFISCIRSTIRSSGELLLIGGL